jgi:hypothetical protein
MTCRIALPSGGGSTLTNTCSPPTRQPNPPSSIQFGVQGTYVAVPLSGPVCATRSTSLLPLRRSPMNRWAPRAATSTLPRTLTAVLRPPLTASVGPALSARGLRSARRRSVRSVVCSITHRCRVGSSVAPSWEALRGATDGVPHRWMQHAGRLLPARLR